MLPVSVLLLAVAGGLAAALCGILDWSRGGDGQRNRAGLIHAGINLGAVTVFGIFYRDGEWLLAAIAIAWPLGEVIGRLSPKFAGQRGRSF